MDISKHYKLGLFPYIGKLVAKHLFTRYCLRLIFCLSLVVSSYMYTSTSPSFPFPVLASLNQFSTYVRGKLMLQGATYD